VALLTGLPSATLLARRGDDELGRGVERVRIQLLEPVVAAADQGVDVDAVECPGGAWRGNQRRARRE
jgi:hypothetical protein